MSYLHDPFPLGFAVNKRNGKLQTKKVMFAFINKKVIFEFMYAFGEVKKICPTKSAHVYNSNRFKREK